MKKLIAFIFAFVMLGVVTASAEYITVDDAANKWCAAAFYDETGSLTAVRVYTFDADGGADIERITDDCRLYFAGADETVILEPAAEETAEPTVEPTSEPEAESTIEPTEEPTAEPTAEATEEPEATVPPIYQNEADAMYTFYVVKGISYVSVDGEQKIEIDALNRGEEKLITVDEDTVLTATAPLLTAYDGASVTTLCEGDVIVMSASPSGKLKSINLILRLDANPFLTDDDYGSSFENLFASGGIVGGNSRNTVMYYGSNSSPAYYGYAFGCIFDKSVHSLTLYDKTGLSDREQIFALSEDTMVYIYDSTESDPLYIGTIYEIEESSIDPAHIDSDYNVTEWTDDDYLNLALVRESDGVVTDIVVYMF